MKNLLCIVGICFSLPLLAQQVVLTPVVSGLSTITDVRHAGDKRLFLLEQAGKVRLLDSLANLQGLPFLNITDRVLSGGERGLLGIAFDPDFKANGLFYVNYTRKPDGHTRISRFRLTGNPSHCDSSTEKIILTIYQPYSNHNGGHIAFGPDGYLYIGMGDGGNGGDPGNRAQNLDSLLGKMLRLDVRDTTVAYKIPAGNPYVNKPGRDEIWSYGLRNPWGWSFDRLTGDMWIADVGQDKFEEVDLEPAGGGGRNYGWRCYEADSAYNNNGCGPRPDYRFPIYTYKHSGVAGCSVTGGYSYRGTKYELLYGRYLFSDACSGNICYLTETTPGIFANTTTNIKLSSGAYAFGEDANGELYVASSSTLYAISDTGCLNPVISPYDTLHLFCTDSVQLRIKQYNGYSYNWMLNSNVIGGANGNSYTVKSGGVYRLRAVSAGCNSLSAPVSIIYDTVNIIISAAADTVCQFNGLQTLSAKPTGGLFFGLGVSGNKFDPSVAGPGLQQVKYSISEAISHCSVSDSDYIYVQAAPQLNFAMASDSFCVQSPIQTLAATPVGGVFTGKGISGNQFDPAAAGKGLFTLTYQYTDTITGCRATASTAVRVYTPSIYTILTSDTLCSQAQPQLLTGSPAGGFFSGWAVSGNLFNPTMASKGFNIISYTYTDTAAYCPSLSASTYIYVYDPLPVHITSATDTACIYSAPVVLNGTPAGGFFGGRGVSGNMFNAGIAGAGMHNLIYWYNDSAAFCFISDTLTMFVDSPAANLILQHDTICINAAPMQLVGLPQGGVFAGAGVSANKFYPAQAGLLQHKITYSITDAFGCSAIDTEQVFVDLCLKDYRPGADKGIRVYPNPNKGESVLNIHSAIYGSAKLIITDLSGQAIYSSAVMLHNGDNQIQLQLLGLAAGMYQIELVAASQSWSSRITIVP